MKIVSVNIPKEINDLGISDIKMNRLDKLVLIAGKNGAGKTRLFKKIQGTINAKPTTEKVAEANRNLKIAKENIIRLKSNLERLNKDKLIRAISSDRYQQIEKQTIDTENEIQYYDNVADKASKTIDWDLIKTTESSDRYLIVPFVPKHLDVTNPNQYTRDGVIQHAAQVSKPGLDTIHQGALAKIQDIQDRWWNATHQNSTISANETKAAVDEHDKLKLIIRQFLDTEIGRAIDGRATLFGFNFGDINLSDGQKVLLQFCMAVYSQEEALKNLILLLDEPENHLHSSVIIETIDRILSCTTDGQVWISTHSIPLLAHYDPKYLWYMSDGVVSYAGDKPEKVLRSLLGDDEEIGKLQDFIGLPAQFATTRYAIECLFEPKAVTTDGKDSQTLQIKKEISGILKGSSTIKILDFGAGKGRLIQNIFEQFNLGREEFGKLIDYIAYDQFEDDKEVCESSIKNIYDSGYRYFNDLQHLLSHHDKASFDIIVLCNVLHEIDPLEWLDYFGKNGKLTTLLNDKGILLVVEDLQIPNGEKAYQKGFIVYDTPQLKELFGVTETDTKIGYGFSDARGDSRLKAHRIPKECLTRITPESRINSLISLRNSAQDQILKIRSLDRNYKNGKLHGFYVQQYANSSLAIRQLKIEND